MKKTLILSLFLFVLFSKCAMAAVNETDCFSYYKFQDGLRFENFHVDKYNYTITNEVIVSYNLKSYMESPIIQGSILAQIYYDDGIAQNQIDQFFVAKDINMMLGDSISQEFRWKIPEYAKSGRYIVKVYFIVADRFNLVGIHFIPSIPGKETDFQVINPTSSYSRIYFDQSSTYLNDEKYNFIGFLSAYDSGTPIDVKTKIINDGKVEKSVKVLIETYDFDDLNNKLDSKEENLIIEVGKSKDISYSYKDTSSGVYMIKFTALDGENVISIMKVRVSLAGIKGIFNYIGLTNFPLLKDHEANLFFCLSNSADYVTSFNGTGKIEVIDNKGNVIFTENFGPFGIYPTEPQGKITSFVPQTNLFNVKIKGYLYSDGKLIDSKELTYDYHSFQKINRNLGININKYYTPGSILNYKISYKDDYGNPLKGSLMFYLSDEAEKLLYSDDVNINGYIEGKIDLSDMEKGEYKLSVIDFKNDVKSEKNFKISLLVIFIFATLALVIILAIVLTIIKRRKVVNENKI